MSEQPKIKSSAEGQKSEPKDLFADFTKNLNARLSGKEIDLDTYKFFKQTIDSLKSAADPKKELNALLSGKKIKLEDFKELRKITDEIAKGKEPHAHAQPKKKELTAEGILAQRRAGFIGAQKRAGHTEKTEKGWQFDDSVKEKARKEMEAELAKKPAAAEAEKTDEDLEALRDVLSGKTVDSGKPKEGAPISRDELLQQMTDAMKKGDVKETHRLSEILNPTPGGEAAKEKPQDTEAEKTQGVAERFTEEFGITAKELREIPGYGELTEGQKEMVFENLRQMTLGRIQEEAGKAYRTNTAQAKFFGRIWQGASKKYQIAKLEKQHAEEFSYGGMEAHGKILEKLVQGAKEGPEAIRNKNGTLDIRFVSEKTLEELAGGPLPEDTKKNIEKLNASIAVFARTPHEWSLASASRIERKQYEAAKKRYEAARGFLLQEMKRANGTRHALEDTLMLDQKVQMTQFLTTHPKVERELQKIESKHLWTRALTNTITEKGVYALFGALSRTVAVGMFGAIGAPLAAAGMGGFVARGRAKETLREDARLARKGSTKMETSNLYRPARDSEGNIIRNPDGSIKQEFAKQVRRESRDYVKAEVLAKRIESLIEKSHIYGPKGDLAAKQLDRLLQYADAKLKNGLINFGVREEGIKNQFELIKELGMARAKLGARNQKSETYARLNAALKGREEKISAKEKKYVHGQMIRGALLAGAFAGAGRAVAEYFYAGNRSPFMPPDEEAEIGREIKKATGAEMRGISAPPETPVAAPDEEAEIGRAVKEATGAEMRGALEFTPEQLRESARAGDSVWKIAERKLEALYGEKFSGLDEARRTYLIDAIKDEIARDPKKFGLENIDRIKIGQTIDFSGILDDKEKMASVFSRANDLDDAVRESIVKNNKMIADWVGEHPREALTSERVEEILRAKPSKPEIPTDYMHDSWPMRHESFYNGVTLAEAEAYGSRESAFFAKLAGLSEHEYRAIRGVKIKDILEQIPSEREARIIWEGQIPGHTINLPSFEQYDKNEFEGHVRLAGILRHYLERNPHKDVFLDVTLDDFFKTAAPEEGPVFRGATPPDFLEPEEFAQNPQPIEQTHGRFSTEPYTAEYTPPDQKVGSVLIEGKDIRDFGSAEEAFVAKSRLGMIPGEWQNIRSLETRELLSQTPEGAAKMNLAELRQWYETAKPKLPGANSFDSFRKQALLADAIRESLATKADPEYLKSLPVRELVRNFVLEETGKGSAAQETVEKAADHLDRGGVQAP